MDQGYVLSIMVYLVYFCYVSMYQCTGIGDYYEFIIFGYLYCIYNVVVMFRDFD